MRIMSASEGQISGLAQAAVVGRGTGDWSRKLFSFIVVLGFCSYSTNFLSVSAGPTKTSSLLPWFAVCLLKALLYATLSQHTSLPPPMSSLRSTCLTWTVTLYFQPRLYYLLLIHVATGSSRRVPYPAVWLAALHAHTQHTQLSSDFNHWRNILWLCVMFVMLRCSALPSLCATARALTACSLLNDFYPNVPVDIL